MEKRYWICVGFMVAVLMTMGLFATDAATCFPPPSGLVNWWPGSSNATDVVGTNHGTLRNGVSFTNGMVGQAFRFSNSNQLVQISAAPIAPPWSAEFWVNRLPSPENSAVLIGDTNTALKLEQYNDTKKVGFTKWGIPGGDCSFNYTVPTNTWVHLVFVGTTTNMQLYVNGALQGTNPTNSPFALPRGQIGRDITNRNMVSAKPLNGLVDEPSIYNRALSTTEIQFLFNAGSAGKCDASFTSSSPVVLGWGYNYFGPVTPPSGLSNAIAIAAGGSHSMALKSNGKVEAWGTGGQTNVPAGLSNVIAIAAGGSHSMALKSNGKVEAWGTGGQTNVPAGLSNVIAIAAGGSHSMALKSDGKVEAWGANYSGQTNVPVGLSNVMAIAAGNSHSMALRSNGTVVAWGSAYYGQTNVPWGLSNVIAIAAGSDCSLSLTYSPPSRPSNDNFTNAIPVIGSVATVVGSNTNASQEVGEGNHSNFEGGGVSVWWSWTAPSNGMLNIDTIGSTFIPELAVYTGINISNLTNRAADYGGGGNRSRILNLPVTANLKYYIALDGYAGQQGGISMSLSCYFNDNFTNRQNMTGTNVVFQASTSNATNEPNEPAHLLFNSPAHSVWYSWKAPFTGGVVIFGDGTLAGDDDLDGAILAVYSGTNFPTMTRLVSDVSLDQSSSSPSIEGYDGPAYVRVVFNAISNQTYQIAVDGLDGGQGILNLSLAIFTPPSNDSFSNRLAIVGNSYTTNGTFIGATRDPGELEHAPPFGFPQTVWWSWTAPTNNGVTNSEVLLMASGVSFAPGIEVYSATNLTNSPISYGKIELINGLPESPFGGPPNPMTRMALFTAQAGATYNIVLSGTQFTPLGGFVSPRYGDFNFSLQNRVLAMTVTNESWQTNETNDTLFDADVIVRNFGATAGGPLRVSVSAISGVSVTRIDAEATLGGDALIITNLPSVPFVLAPGQSNLIHISGVVPPPSYITASDAKGYAAFAQLQEEKGSGQWFSVDQAFVVYGVWPTNTGARSPNGPGGGVIRLDPALTGDEFNPLTNVAVLGPLVVPEGRQTNYIGLAQFSDGFQTNFTGTVWLSTLFNITNGLLSTASITSNMPVILTTKYSSEGFEYSANLGILVSNLPAPTLKSLQVTSNGNFILQLDGVANRKHVIQATTNLALPVTWTSLLTNTAGANGLLNFTNLIGTNRQRFFRAKETE